MALAEAKSEEKLGTAVPETKQVVPVSVKNVLFATDFSVPSEAALPYAAAVCRRFEGTLHTAHVLSDTSLLMMTGGVDYVSMGTLYEDASTAAKEKLEQISSRLEGIPLRSYVRHGKVWENLAVIAQENHIDLIVVGTHGRTGLGKILLGSVAENILRHASCPVLTVGPNISGRNRLPAIPAKGHDLAPPQLECRQILVATNYLRNAQQLVQAAISLAAEFRARLTLLHVIEDYTELAARPNSMEEGLRRLQALLPCDVTLPYPPETELDFGSPSELILKIAQEREADLIVLGARTASEIGGTHMPWSTAHDVIAHAHCPVLTLRA